MWSSGRGQHKAAAAHTREPALSENEPRSTGTHNGPRISSEHLQRLVSLHHGRAALLTCGASRFGVREETVDSALAPAVSVHVCARACNRAGGRECACIRVRACVLVDTTGWARGCHRRRLEARAQHRLGKKAPDGTNKMLTAVDTRHGRAARRGCRRSQQTRVQPEPLTRVPKPTEGPRQPSIGATGHALTNPRPRVGG